MKTRIIDGLEGLDGLGAAWEKLESGARLPMQQFIWVRTCAAAFASRGELRVLVVENGGEVLAVAPFVKQEGNSCLEMLGTSQLYEPSDAVFSTPEALAPLADALIDLGIPLHLRRLPAASPLVKALSKAFRGRGLCILRPDGSWPSVPLDPGWAEPESKFNSKRRAYLRRARRIAEEFGTVKFDVLIPTPASLAPMLEEALAVEAAGWKGETGTALALDPVVGSFYRGYAKAACEKGILRLCFLRIGGRAAAMQLGVETMGRLWLMKIGYDEQFAHASPGQLLMLESIRQAAGQGRQSVGLLGVMEPWKKQWTREENLCVVLRGYPYGWRGLSRFAGDITQTTWTKCGHALRRAPKVSAP